MSAYGHPRFAASRRTAPAHPLAQPGRRIFTLTVTLQERRTYINVSTPLGGSAPRLRQLLLLYCFDWMQYKADNRANAERVFRLA